MELLKNNSLEKILTLLEVAGDIKGRTKFQKIVYILKNRDVPFREKFKYHYFGPFSSDLQLEIDELVDRDILEEKSNNPYVYGINKKSELKFNRDSDISKKRDLIHFLNKRDYRELEVASTIYFLEENGMRDEYILRKKVQALKPHLKDYIDSSFELKEEINAM